MHDPEKDGIEAGSVQCKVQLLRESFLMTDLGVVNVLCTVLTLKASISSVQCPFFKLAFPWNLAITSSG